MERFLLGCLLLSLHLDALARLGRVVGPVLEGQGLAALPLVRARRHLEPDPLVRLRVACRRGNGRRFNSSGRHHEPP